MLTDIGEYIVGTYLQLIEECDFIDYNVRPPGGGLKGLSELDVVGLNLHTSTAYLCEVITHDVNNSFFRTLQIMEHMRVCLKISWLMAAIEFSAICRINVTGP